MAQTKEHFQIAIVGSGPAGLSAAARATALGFSHVVLERSDQVCDTVEKYQKHKLVMATPYGLPVRAAIHFEEGSREQVLKTWHQDIETTKTNIRLNSDVTEVTRTDDGFIVQLGNASPILASQVIMAMGIQGNIRKLNIPGADSPKLQYHLEDAEAYEGKSIVVIGGGDSGIEDALALSAHNKVTLVNRSDDFIRATERNTTLISAKIQSKSIAYYSDANPVRITDDTLDLELKSGITKIDCDFIFARIGAAPPRDFLERIGIEFSSTTAEAIPIVDVHYQSNVAGLYIIGSLGGYPLIKQALNQGYEVVDYIAGLNTPHADEEILLEKLSALGQEIPLDQKLTDLQARIKLLAPLSRLQLREFLLEVTVHKFSKGDAIFNRDEYGDSLFLIYQGAALGVLDPDRPEQGLKFDEGEYFGEIGLMAGRRRIATVIASDPDNLMIEVPRSTSLKWSAAVESIRNTIELSTIKRELRAYLSADLEDAHLNQIIDTVQLRDCKAGDFVYRTGDQSLGVYVIRKGAVTVSKEKDGSEVVVSYVPAGNYLGEVSMLSGHAHSSNVKAAITCKLIFIPAKSFHLLLQECPTFRHEIEGKLLDRLTKDETTINSRTNSFSAEQFVDQGIADATDILLIDESLCIHCDNCMSACSGTHNGISRLNIRAGTTVGNIRIPTSCRHCEHPHCTADCPTNAIRRSENGEVLIDDSCVGCGNCMQNCPYGVITMQVEQNRDSGEMGFFARLAPKFARAESKPFSITEEIEKKVAVKCDMCRELPSGPACVAACPTGAAARVTSEDTFDLVKAASR